MLTKKKVDYQSYIRSKAWRDRHPAYLKRSGHRCAMFPWIRVGDVGDRYHPYSLHHMTYENLGNEKYWLDVLPVSKFAHKHIIHGILAGYKSAGRQKSYPNAAQRIAHFWCRLPLVFKGAIALYTGWLLMQ